MQGNLLFQLLLVGSDVLKLWGEGGVLVGLALARPTKAFTTSKPDRSNLPPKCHKFSDDAWKPFKIIKIRYFLDSSLPRELPLVLIRFFGLKKIGFIRVGTVGISGQIKYRFRHAGFPWVTNISDFCIIWKNIEFGVTRNARLRSKGKALWRFT